MLKKMMLAFLVIALPGLMSCDYDSSGADPESMAAVEAFDQAFRPSAESVTAEFNDASNDSILQILSEQDGSFWVENDAFKPVFDAFVANPGSAESIDALLSLIKNALLNPWTLLDTMSLNGTHGCVTWSTGVDFDLQVTQAIQDYLNGKWWTLSVLVDLEECDEVSGQFKVDIAGSKLGIVYTVHVTGELTVDSIPDKVFDLDIIYDLEDAMGEWDSVDWSVAVNGVKIHD